MSLISILVFVTAALTFATGLLSFLGASRADRNQAAWFFVSNIGSVVWSIACATFLILPVGADGAAVWMVFGIYLGALLMITPMLGFVAWKYKLGKVATILFILLAVALGLALVYDPGVLFTKIVLSNSGNTVELISGWWYWCYAIFHACIIAAFLGLTFYRARHAKTKRVKMSSYVLLVGLSVCGILSLVFNMVLPIMGTYSLIWAGPLTLSVVMLTYFYAILKYRAISVASGWLKIFAYAVIMLSGVAVYMVLFYLVFTALFKIPNPSASVLVLNFLMIVIVLLLMPVISEINTQVRAMIMVGQVDIAYVIKKLNRVATKNVDLRELAAFLADHLHFTYLGFVINGRLYGSKTLAVSADELEAISHLRAAARSDVWQEPNKTVQKILDELDLKAVAELRNAKGKPFGQLLVGKPIGKSSFERRDLIQLEMIINLVATVIDSEKHIRA